MLMHRPGQHVPYIHTPLPGPKAQALIAADERREVDARLPGHGDRTTIGTERPHLQEWIDRGW